MQTLRKPFYDAVLMTIVLFFGCGGFGIAVLAYMLFRLRMRVALMNFEYQPGAAVRPLATTAAGSDVKIAVSHMFPASVPKVRPPAQ